MPLRLVRPESLDQPEGMVRLGSIVHAVLAATHSSLLEEGAAAGDVSYAPRAREVMRAHLARLLAELSRSIGPSETRLLAWETERRCAAALALDLTRQGAFAPVALEYTLPREGVDVGGFRINGRIDRIDRLGTAGGRQQVFVIDYKSGQSAYGPHFAKDRALQVPLYMLALRAERPDWDVVGGAYLALGASVARGAVRSDAPEAASAWLTGDGRLDPDAFEAELAAVRDVAGTAVENMRRGLIQAEPPKECPSWCDLRPICRTSAPVRRW